MSDVVINTSQQFVDGFLFGSTYALVAIGFTLIFGVMHKLNLAFGIIALAGAYIAAFFFNRFNLGTLFTFAVGVVASAAISGVVLLTCFQFMPSNRPIASLVATIGMLFFVEEVIAELTEGMPYPFPQLLGETTREWGPFFFRIDLIFTFLIALLAVALLYALVYRTRLGLSTRAVSQQVVAAQLCGIRLGWVNGATFVLAGALAGIAGVTTAATVGVVSPLMAVPLTIKGLVAAVVGGLSSLRGAIICGLGIGVLEAISLQAFGVTYRDATVLILLFAFLVFRPSGLFPAAAMRDS